jgi:hypothetical protein
MDKTANQIQEEAEVEQLDTRENMAAAEAPVL